MQFIQDYIVALTNLYGLVHKRKVVDIYNQLSNETIDVETIDTIMNESAEELESRFVFIEDDYFVHEAIFLFDDIADEVKKRQGKPHFVPSESELLNYTDDEYVEKTKQYNKLFRYVTKYICDGDTEEAADICLDITGSIQSEVPLSTIISELNHYGFVFDDEEHLNEVVQLVVNHVNNTRLWSNNGHTPNELSAYEPHFLASTQPTNLAEKLKKNRQTKLEAVARERRKIKVGRNDPCPCGSGKKYKKCCMK